MEKPNIEPWQMLEGWERADALEKELTALREAVRKVIFAKGRHNTEVATRRMFDLLPERKEASHAPPA